MIIKKRYFFIIFIVALLLALVVWLSRVQRYIEDKPMRIDNAGYLVEITPGMQVQKIADRLYEDGIFQHPMWFILWVRYKDLRVKLKAGEYLLKPGTTPQAFIDMMVAGRVVQHPLTIVPGWTFDRMMLAVHQEPNLKHLLIGKTPEEIMTMIGYPNQHPEGLFYPDTYHFPKGTTDIQFLQRAYLLLKDKLDKAWAARDLSLPLKSPYEALILASIIEKESNLPEEYAEIAGVYARRIERNMPLQADPTVAYGLGKNYTGSLTLDMLKIPTPYNTYTNIGLPPTPIALLEQKSLYAATHPKPGDTLYFVARGEGRGHVFSKTFEEHLQAVQQYRKAMASVTGN